MIFIALIFPPFLINSENDYTVQSTGASEWFVIEGLVDNPINITYAELKYYPLISEVAMLQCVGGGQGGPKVTYNWTGVPLFYLLSMAKVVSGGYREVVFNATDGFSSSVPLEVAMDPTTILAFEANGTDLEQIAGLGGGYKVVLPCRWGYKWVKWIKQIIIVDYDYKGTYERQGFSDEALRPNSTMPLTTPPSQNFSSTETGGQVVQALSNFSILSFSFQNHRRLVFNVTGLSEGSGYFYVTFSTDLFGAPYEVFVDRNLTGFSQISTDKRVYLYFGYAYSANTIEIEGVSAFDISEGGSPSLIPLLQ